MKITDLQVLQACADKDTFGAINKLVAATGQCEKVCFRALERVCGKDLIEYGTSLNGAWLTDKGEDVLSASGERAASPSSDDAVQ